MPYCQLFYHLIWATKEREPVLTGDVERVVHNLLRAKAIELGAQVFELDGIEDHVHMVASIPPAIAVAKFVGQVKGASSAKFNQTGFTRKRFFWQDEYGAFSFDRKRLPNFVAYVQDQKRHHARHTMIPVLERTRETSQIRELEAVYAVEEDRWRRELLAIAQ